MSELINDPWVVQAPKQMEQVPVGMYNAKFKGIEDFKMPQTGEAKWRFSWSILTGPQAGKEASALCDRNINPNTLPGRLIAGLLGRALVVGETVKASIDACVGKTYMVSVQAGPKGGKVGVQSVGTPPPM